MLRARIYAGKGAMRRDCLLLPRRKNDLDLSRSEEQSFGDVLPSISGSKPVPDTIHFPRDAVTTTSGSTRNRHFFVYIASKPTVFFPRGVRGAGA